MMAATTAAARIMSFNRTPLGGFFTIDSIQPTPAILGAKSQFANRKLAEK
jgi:hypothetical protein